jgi:hypothetical protein
MQIKIKERFKYLIPPIGADEYAALTESIKAEGIRDLLIVWNGYIVDGHNRYEIAKKLGYEDDEIKVSGLCIEDEDEVCEWILHNQLGRRNLTDADKLKLASEYKKMREERARKNQERTFIQNQKNIANGIKDAESPSVLAILPKPDENKNTTIYSIAHSDEPQNDITDETEGENVAYEEYEAPETVSYDDEEYVPINARKEAAERFGVGERTLGKYEQVIATAPEPLRRAMEEERVSVNRAYEINRELRSVPERERDWWAKEYLRPKPKAENPDVKTLHSLIFWARKHERIITRENITELMETAEESISAMRAGIDVLRLRLDTIERYIDENEERPF